MAEDHAACARAAERCELLRRGRHDDAVAATSAGTAGDLPEVADGIPREEASRLPQVLLRVRPRSSGDPWTGQRLSHNPGTGTTLVNFIQFQI